MNRCSIVFQIGFIFLIVFFQSSCSSTAHSSKSKYSSANKRNHKETSTRKYVYHSGKSKEATTVKNNSASISAVRKDIVDSAKSYRGSEYKSGGKSPETGFDCSGFTSFIFNQNGIQISGPSDKQATLGKQKTMEKLLPGDLVFFGNEERISHVAIVSSNNNKEVEVVHATTSAGVKIDNISQSDYWRTRFLFGVDVLSK